MKRATISDVAKEVGVSATTISHYLNGRFNKMSPETKEAVKQAIKRLQYRPFSSARDMRQQHTKMIGVIVADTTNMFSSLLFTGIYNFFQPLGYSVLLLNANNSGREEGVGIDRLLSQRVDGFIIQASRRHFRSYKNIVDAGTALVFADREVDGQPAYISKVVTNNFASSYNLGSEAAKRGYTRLILVCRIKNISAQSPRIAGFRSAAADFHEQVSMINIFGHDDLWLQKELLAMTADKTQRTLLVALMGPILFKILSFCREFKVAFPQDVGLLSFDDWNWSRFVADGIDLMEQDPMEMGRQSAMNLHQSLLDGPDKKGKAVVVAAKRVYGGSF
ncbi:LacI family DNA-binding transcriptional regulator [Oenococcus kitaharae]|uniref:LacI family transcriptional regulator n=1 Tax=Oenococcus kitaharae DSM 17330 TaxID=1045004 RepID=G9WGF7_9LACO|nr:LacI family DNA-binding transcriptional regulator [Oenococcus kitaharae]EHN59784.1 LacI family transcriptional regulator [Oenococcus kitaharae DSM 17330]OEY83604.1 hypothetical protein NT95_05750 [Oenococcus kitaharae]OEY85402.1 hypothetical protein NT96_02195 [Oenococcus kitaharae]OEY86255.1 hypothetical protein NV75_02145 [Oenococcus kitaharae]